VTHIHRFPPHHHPSTTRFPRLPLSFPQVLSSNRTHLRLEGPYTSTTLPSTTPLDPLAKVMTQVSRASSQYPHPSTPRFPRLPLSFPQLLSPTRTSNYFRHSDHPSPSFTSNRFMPSPPNPQFFSSGPLRRRRVWPPHPASRRAISGPVRPARVRACRAIHLVCIEAAGARHPAAAPLPPISLTRASPPPPLSSPTAPPSPSVRVCRALYLVSVEAAGAREQERPRLRPSPTTAYPLLPPAPCPTSLP
jgi:hypothetical protein